MFVDKVHGYPNAFLCKIFSGEELIVVHAPVIVTAAPHKGSPAAVS
ncbi:hypothetical protein KKG31_02300 [Patescibacteria group bacterium]|nr:hypothetical protein [Patescibacteria group bacterium]MBU1758001.1 hypothetical protein [Patescibacteria group bacterium]